MTSEAGLPTASHALPAWSSVLAVVAHPDDESFALGAVLDAFARSGATVSVLCFTRGEASSLLGVSGDLALLRAAELQSAAAALGLDSAILGDHPDGALVGVDQGALAAEVSAAIGRSHAEGLVVFDPSGVTGHPDHAAASAAAMRAAAMADLPVLGWTLPREVAERLNDEFGTGFVGHQPPQIDLTVTVDRDRQRMASLAHASQAVPTSVLWRRLELLGDIENLRWLRTRDTPASAVTVASPRSAGDATAFTSGSVPPAAGGSPDAATLRVVYVSGDRFEVSIREHVVTVDQPVQAGGQDIGPTPTELFVAGLASCVAFYARRYLRRHKLDATGLTVATSYRMGTKPARVTQVDMQIQVPADLPPARLDGLLAVASHCTVHNSITTAPQITIAVAPEQPEAHL